MGRSTIRATAIQGWTVEGRIPWTAFQPSGGKPKPGDVWRFALCRYDYGPEGTKPVLMSSAPLTQPSFHRHEDYGKLRFDGPPQVEQVKIKSGSTGFTGWTG